MCVLQNSQTFGGVGSSGASNIESEARDKAGEGSGVGARWAPLRKILKIQTLNSAIWCNQTKPELRAKLENFFWKIEFEISHFGAHLKRTFEINDNMVRDQVQLPTFMKKSIFDLKKLFNFAKV